VLGSPPPAAPPRPALPAGLVVAGAGFLPGALIGTHLAGLIFFLNPDLAFEPAPVARGVLVYGLLAGAATLLASLPFLWGRPQRARRFLPWGVTAALVVAAALDWAHASHYAYYLPPGINRRMIKAAVWLSVAALVAFYTALLHTLARRRYGPRSRLAFVALALVSIVVMVERREAFRPGSPASPRPSLVEAANRPTLLVVGLEGATLDAMLPLASQGRLPFLASLLEEGAYGRLESLRPFRRRALWTTLATGKYPFKHGVLADRRYPAPLLAPGAALEVLPEWLGFAAWGTLGRPPVAEGGGEREALAVWEVLPLLGVETGVVGWPASHPPGPGPTFTLSDRYFAAPATPGAARPAALAGEARLFRLRAADVDPLVLASFGEEVPPALVRALADDLWRESLASPLLQQHPGVDALFIQLDGLATVSQADLGGYAAAQFEGAPGAGYQEAARRVAAFYAQLDLFLSRLWDRVPPPKLMVVVSAYGAEPPHGWRRLLSTLAPGEALAAGFEGSPDGVLLLAGEGVRPGVLLTGARLVDLVPTLCYGLGLPIARDLDGRVLTGAFEREFLARHPLTFLPSYETLEGVGGGARGEP
jgi:hypothetical protein